MRRRDWSFLLLAPVAGVALTALSGAYQQPSFKTGVQLVRIDVSVLDDKRQPVRGLQASDFTVLEDGQPRPVRSFQAVDVSAAPPSRATMAPVPAHTVVTNQMSRDSSRLIFIVMDRSIAPERPAIMARQIADAAVDAMAPGDLAAILATGVSGVPQNLTSDRARLHKTIASRDWSQGLSHAQTDDPILAQLDMNNPLTDGRCMCGLCAMDAIMRIANDVRDVPRRKILLFVGSDIVLQTGDPDCGRFVRDSREKLFDALGASGLTVHSIDPNGLASVTPLARASIPNGLEEKVRTALNQQLAKEHDQFMAAQGALAVLPDLTGGRTILNSNEPFRMIPDMLHESDAYYLLAFEPVERTGDVRHTIDVKVARKGVTVHTTRYILPSGSTATANGAPAAESPLERALTGVLPDQSLPLGMSVASFAGPDAGHAYVGITLDASAFAATPGSIPLDIALLASDERGKTAGGARQTGTVQVPLGGGGVAGSVELQTYLTLPPGEYELRAAVMNGDTRAASSVFTHITVPSFEDTRLDLSDVVIGTHDNAGTLPDDAPAIPIVPTTARAFAAGEPAWAFVRVYRAAGADADQRVSIDTTVLDADGQAVRHQSLQRVVFTGRNADVRVGLPLKDLAAGRYELRIDAKQGRLDASRTVVYTVAATVPTIPEERSPELTSTLDAAAAYLEQYEHRISAIGAVEDYQQAVTPIASSVAAGLVLGPRNGAGGPGVVRTRKTRANMMTIDLGPQGWVSFRDVFQVDGRTVRGREERLPRLLQNVTPDSLEQARQIAAESARYNLDSDAIQIDRTINVPMTALLFLRAANQSRSSFHLGKPERVGGVECVALQFTERTQPRLIHTADDAPAEGTFWLDMANGGRILKTEIRLQSVRITTGYIRSDTTVTYARVEKLDLWVPTVMDETYEVTATRQAVTGHATYSEFHEFKVTTSTDIK